MREETRERSIVYLLNRESRGFASLIFDTAASHRETHSTALTLQVSSWLYNNFSLPRIEKLVAEGTTFVPVRPCLCTGNRGGIDVRTCSSRPRGYECASTTPTVFDTYRETFGNRVRLSFHVLKGRKRKRKKKNQFDQCSSCKPCAKTDYKCDSLIIYTLFTYF